MSFGVYHAYAINFYGLQQALLNILQPIFEPDFHPSSYGYRPGRSCHKAVAKAEMYINKYGLEHVVDMDLSKCFDRLNHELILNTKSSKQKKSDGSVLFVAIHPKKIKKFQRNDKRDDTQKSRNERRKNDKATKSETKGMG